MRRQRTMRTTAGLALGIVAMFEVLGLGSFAQSSNPNYVVLSKTQAMIAVDCTKGCMAALGDFQTLKIVLGSAGPALDNGKPVPYWSMVRFVPTDFQFESKQTYVLKITHLGPDGKPAIGPDGKTLFDIVTIDTTPVAQLSSKAPGKNGVDLSSNVAIALPGSTTPLRNSLGNCPDPGNANGSPPHHVGAPLLLPQFKVDLTQTELCETDIAAPLSLASLNEISVIPGIFTPVHSAPSPPVKGKTIAMPALLPIVGLSDVLGDQLEVAGKESLAKSKAPANKDAAWLWINGTVTAGTGAAPAWVLDGKLAPFPTMPFNSATVFIWFSTTANIGNNKIGGQAAKDVIDFGGPSLNYFKDWKEVGGQFSAAPVYETNLALNHRNLLAVGDVIWDSRAWNQTQFVRTALKYGPTKMPKEVNYSPGGYVPLGWSLHLHTGFEAGGALEAVAVTNSKTKKTVGTIPTYSIARVVPQVDGTLQYKWFGFESDLTARYLFTTEHTAVNDKLGNPYLETVSGWKAVNVGTFSITPADQHLALTIAYTSGFSAPTYQRANGIKIGLLVKY